MAELPKDIRHFIRDNIDSVEMLHVLFLVRENPDRVWSVEAISTELRSSSNSIRHRLGHLHRRGFLSVSDDAFSYNASAVDDTAVQRLLELYRDRRTSVIDAIFSADSDSLRAFSEAFKFGERQK